MLRPVRDTDLPHVIDLVVAAGMFARDEAEFLRAELAGLGTKPQQPFCLVADDGDGSEDGAGLRGVAYARPEEAADRVWDLTMIAVAPAAQRGGQGRELLAAVEATLRERGQRLLVVRTSGTAAYDGARAFYRRWGYAEAATVADWWTDGDPLVLFTKDLRGA